MWAIIESFANILLGLLQYIVEHENIVNNVLELIKGVLKYAAEHVDVIIEIFKAVVEFKILRDVIGKLTIAVGTAGLIKAISGATGALSGASGLISMLGGLETALGSLAVFIEYKVLKAIYDIADEKIAEPKRKNYEDEISYNLAIWENYYQSTHNGQAAPRDENGRYMLPDSVIKQIEQNLYAKIDASDDLAIIKGYNKIDQQGRLYNENGVYTDDSMSSIYGIDIDDAVNVLKNPDLQKEATKSINVQTEATNSNTKSLDEVISMGYELKDVGTDLVATYTKTDAEIKNAKSLDDLISGRGIKSTRSISGYANGGIPKSGSLFFANENGNSELIGNFGGYSGVANNQMIMSSIQNGVYQAVKKALAESNGSSQTNNITVAPDGLFIGDEASIRKLATLINNANRKSNQNIANTGYVM